MSRIMQEVEIAVCICCAYSLSRSLGTTVLCLSADTAEISRLNDEPRQRPIFKQSLEVLGIHKSEVDVNETIAESHSIGQEGSQGSSFIV